MRFVCLHKKSRVDLFHLYLQVYFLTSIIDGYVLSQDRLAEFLQGQQSCAG